MTAKFAQALMMVLVSAPAALAAESSAASHGVFGIVFLGFFALILAVQLVPGLALLVSMIKGMFGGQTSPTSK